MDADRNPTGGTQEAVFLANQRTAKIFQGHWNDRAWIWSGKGHAGFTSAVMGENRNEQTFAGYQSFAGADQLVHQAGARLGMASVAEQGVQTDAGVLVHHGARFGHGAFSGI